MRSSSSPNLRYAIIEDFAVENVVAITYRLIRLPSLQVAVFSGMVSKLSGQNTGLGASIKHEGVL